MFVGLNISAVNLEYRRVSFPSAYRFSIAGANHYAHSHQKGFRGKNHRFWAKEQ